jgi:DNA-binding response OmpR family regulator
MYADRIIPHILSTPSDHQRRFRGVVKTKRKKCSILVVDDDEHLRSLLCAWLSQEGYEVFSAIDGEQGLKSFKLHSPEVVLTDLQMPHVTGDELARKIRRLKPDATILLMTGMDWNDLPHGLFDDLLQKPFGVRNLAQAIEHARHHHAATP